MKTIDQKIDADTGLIIEECHRLNGRLHRDPNEGPAVIKRDVNGVRVEQYFWQGKLHRTDGPAVVERDTEGRLEQLAWFHQGRHHRDDGPALMIYERGGMFHSHSWYRHGENHRDPNDGPAHIAFSDGVLDEVTYTCEGLDWRDPTQGPWQTRYERGKVLWEEWAETASRPEPGQRTPSPSPQA